jgi:hypothetical protein
MNEARDLPCRFLASADFEQAIDLAVRGTLVLCLPGVRGVTAARRGAATVRGAGALGAGAILGGVAGFAAVAAVGLVDIAGVCATDAPDAKVRRAKLVIASVFIIFTSVSGLIGKFGDLPSSASGCRDSLSAFTVRCPAG